MFLIGEYFDGELDVFEVLFVYISDLLLFDGEISLGSELYDEDDGM